MLNRLLLLVPAVALSLIVGCGEEEERRFGRRTVAIADVPAPLMAAAKKEVPGVDFDEAWSNHVDGKPEIHSYEIRGRNNATGKIREVRIAPDGTILEKE